jgi:hypothetical protein
MGGVRVMVLENNRRESEGDNTHTLMFAEARGGDVCRQIGKRYQMVLLGGEMRIIASKKGTICRRQLV